MSTRDTGQYGFPDPADPNVSYDLSEDELRELVVDDATVTEYGSPAVVSAYRSRSADRTKNRVDHEFSAADDRDIEAALEEAQDREMVALDLQVGEDSANTYTCRYFVPEEYSRIALSLSNLFEPADEEAEPDFRTVQLPDWEGETKIRVDPDAGETYVLGSDYTGEAKKSFLRLFMYEAKQQGGLGLHAGTKEVDIREGEAMETVGQVFMGLSGTGKSTLTSHGLWLDEPEDAAMLQDDVCALTPDGEVHGSEGGGLYIKTEGLEPDEQPELYEAATSEEAVLENVAVEEDGAVDFDDTGLTSNGRAAIRREDLASAADEINLDSIDQFFFITRNPLMPPLAKLDPDQAAAAFMLGESVETGAGDPDSAGESVRVVGVNPFIMGSEGAEGNRFRDLIEATGAETYMLNTGYLGDREQDITVEDTVTLLEDTTRGDVAWREQEAMPLEVPADPDGVDMERFRPETVVDDFAARAEELREERRAYLEQFEDLDEAIVDAVY